MAARGARTAAGDAGGRLRQCRIVRCGPCCRVPQGPQRNWLRRGPERDGGVPLAGGPIRSSAVAHGGPRSPSCGCYRHARQHLCIACGQSGDHDDPNRIRRRRRSGQAWSGRQPCSARRQRDWRQFVHPGGFGQAAWAAHDLVPKAVRVAVLVNPANVPVAESTRREIPEAARAIGLQIQFLNASTSREIEAAFAALVRDRADALFVAADIFCISRRVQLVTLATRHGIPASYPLREAVEVGGLMSYAADRAEMFRQVGDYTGRMLKGVKPADLPVLQMTKFEFVINLQTARALGIEVPPQLLASVDEVIE